MSTESTTAWTAVGDIRIASVPDGISQFPPEYFMPQADWAGEHAALLDADGVMRMPVGCFVIRTGDRTVLVDAGVGPVLDGPLAEHFRCGQLPAALRAVGVAPEDVDVVVCTHLHIDHAGWVSADGRPYFANATVRFGEADWDALIVNGAELTGAHVCDGMRLLDAAGRLAPITTDGEAIAPGVTARATPGHTPGHQTLVVSSGSERLVILGDAVTCPLAVAHPEWECLADVDRELAARTRERLLRELEGERVVGPHFPGLRAGRLLRGVGDDRFTFVP